MRQKDVWFFSIVFALVILSFIGASGYVRHRALDIDQAALDISGNAVPSILHTSRARVEIRNLQLLIEHYLDQADAGLPPTEEIAAGRARLHREVQLYQELPMFPGENTLWNEANRQLGFLDAALSRMLPLLIEHRLEDAKKLASGELRQAGRETINALMNTIEFNAQEAYNRAQEIRELRMAATRSSLVLNLLCVLWTILMLLGLGYGFRRQSQIREEQRRLATERAEELEQFAGRVAHDILNPLSVVTFALSGLASDDPVKQEALLERGRASVRRVVQILDGLLKFACAGAHPEPDARAELRELMAELEAELRAQAAAASIELRVEPFTACSVACSPGILISLVTNLGNNAIKYIGDGPARWIALRVLPRGGVVRIEVEDNGPGLPPDLTRVVFNPWVRAKGNLAPGFGLGLATVKKAVEAHGGRVGVRSVTGRGCLFWFELPSREPPAA